MKKTPFHIKRIRLMTHHLYKWKLILFYITIELFYSITEIGIVFRIWIGMVTGIDLMLHATHSFPQFLQGMSLLMLGNLVCFSKIKPYPIIISLHKKCKLFFCSISPEIQYIGNRGMWQITVVNMIIYHILIASF